MDDFKLKVKEKKLSSKQACSPFQKVETYRKSKPIQKLQNIV